MNSNSFNLAGEFYVLSRLLLKGYVATFTLGNTKGIDILLFNPKNERQFRVEVKTSNTQLQKNSEIFGTNFFYWPHMDKKHEECAKDNLIFCFVNFNKENNPSLWILDSNEVQEYIIWEHNFWKEAEHKRKIKENNKARTLRIYLESDDKDKNIMKLNSQKYKNNFSVFDVK